MNRPADIASFPPLFDDLEAFCTEQLSRVRWLAGIAAALAIAFVLI
ncbi:hypothetical protein ACLIIZ_18025 [Azonexus caeni]|jgi:hypothetical protein